MFFEEKIKSIKEGDRVLEIGPGATPFGAQMFFWKSRILPKKNT